MVAQPRHRRQRSDTTYAHLKNAGNIDSFPAICQLRDKITNLSQSQGTMTGCIVNCYRDNGARTRPHADDESYIDQGFSLTLTGIPKS